MTKFSSIFSSPLKGKGKRGTHNNILCNHCAILQLLIGSVRCDTKSDPSRVKQMEGQTGPGDSQRATPQTGSWNSASMFAHVQPMVVPCARRQSVSLSIFIHLQCVNQSRNYPKFIKISVSNWRKPDEYPTTILSTRLFVFVVCGQCLLCCWDCDSAVIIHSLCTHPVNTMSVIDLARPGWLSGVLC